MELQIILSEPCSAEENMEKDSTLLQQLGIHSVPILHFYDWANPCATYGYFISPEKFLNLQSIMKYGLQLARRPTGGGIVFHLWDFAFSVLIPASNPFFSHNTLENYAFINGIVAKAIKKIKNGRLNPSLFSPEPSSKNSHFCMAQATKYDLIVDGKKIGGAAQRKTKEGFLHQGTISLTVPSYDLLSTFLKDENIVNEIRNNSYFLLQEQSIQAISDFKEELRGCLVEEFAENN